MRFRLTIDAPTGARMIDPTDADQKLPVIEIGDEPVEYNAVLTLATVKRRGEQGVSALALAAGTPAELTRMFALALVGNPWLGLVIMEAAELARAAGEEAQRLRNFPPSGLADSARWN